jgi:predicted acyltransferase
MPTSQQRFLALDVFRGMTICFMIIVNTPGSGEFAYSPLHHAKWNGFTQTDIVYHSFLFAVGTAMSFVMPKWASLSQSQVLAKIFKRTLLIFIIGWLMYWFPFVDFDKDNHLFFIPISHTRILGVLQRIALVYCIGALMIYYFKPRTLFALMILILLLYWFVMMRFGDSPDPLSMTGNIGYYIDKWILGENHMYHGEGVAFEPEGFLSTLPAIGNLIGGWLVGRFLKDKGKTYEGLSKLLLVELACISIGYFWDLLFPINK